VLLRSFPFLGDTYHVLSLDRRYCTDSLFFLSKMDCGNKPNKSVYTTVVSSTVELKAKITVTNED